jgi:hypothetical protein
VQQRRLQPKEHVRVYGSVPGGLVSTGSGLPVALYRLLLKIARSKNSSLLGWAGANCNTTNTGISLRSMPVATRGLAERAIRMRLLLKGINLD